MYTIQLLNTDLLNSNLLSLLQSAIIADGRFRVATWTTSLTWEGARGKKVQRQTLGLRGVRLTHKKPYCGQHFGECPIGTKKPNASYLEWSDWVDFHGLVNTFLDRHQVSANVWTMPMEVKGKMWIRKGLQARVRWDATVEYNGHGQRVQHWNLGDETQFQPEAR